MINPPKQEIHIIAVDGSPDSDAAFKFAVKNLSVNDKFILCHGRHLWNSYLPTYIPEEDKRQIEQSIKIREKYMEWCQKEKRACEYRDLGVVSSTTELSDTISQFAKSVGAKSIIVGSSGTSRLKRAFLGSVSHAIVNSSELPVIVVKEKK